MKRCRQRVFIVTAFKPSGTAKKTEVYSLKVKAIDRNSGTYVQSSTLPIAEINNSESFSSLLQAAWELLSSLLEL